MARPTFLHLNRDGLWPGFTLEGLEREADGTLHLATLPRLVEGEASAVEGLPVPGAPGGIAVDRAGRVFWSDPERGAVLSRDPCDAATGPLACLGPGAPFEAPRGLALHPRRGGIMVADAHAGVVWLLSADAMAIADWWQVPSGAESDMSRPSAIAVLGEHVYVLDAGNARLHKLSLEGEADPAFADAVDAGGSLQQPTAVAASGGAIFVLDAGRRMVVVLDEDGAEIRAVDLVGVGDPMGLAVDGRALFVGDNALPGIVQFDPAGGRVGRAIGYRGPVAALSSTEAGDLWVSPGDGVAPLRLAARGGHVRRGLLRGGPFGFDGVPHLWGRLSALGEPLAEGAHFRFLTLLADDPAAVPPPPGPASGPWVAGPPDGPDIYVGGEAHFLWVAAIFEGDGLASPLVGQIRVDADHEAYSRYLPPLYIREPGQKETVDRFLALFESQYRDVEGAIAEMARLFDPATVPEPWLEWLAGWLAVPIEEAWPEAKKREAIARAFESHGWRGTARGLKDTLRFELGVHAAVEEPIVHAEWWALAGSDGEETPWHETSRLGFATMLTVGPPEGAVLGTTATLDGSRLITDDEFGAPLFDAYAHRFSVLLYGTQDAGLLESVRAVLDREKPAHTAYTLCAIEPAMRVGYQAILGVDTIVGGGPPPATALGRQPTARGLTLAGDTPGRLGAGAGLGTTTHLGDGIVGED